MSDEFNPDSWDAIDGVLQPAQTPELVGHEAVLKRLCSAYASGRMHHAWLLSGPRGIGKATLAFRFADHIMRFPVQEEAPSEMTYRDDSVHGQTARGANPNLLVIRRPYDQKAKKFLTRITAETMRSGLQRFIGNTSGNANWRVVIIDPADDLNTQSANALLKFLEEPPARTVFLIVAQTPRGLLATIRSRCQVLLAKPLDNASVAKVISRQPLTEALNESDTERLLRHAAGSPGRAMLLADSDVIAQFEAFRAAAEAKVPDIVALHKVAGAMAPPNKGREYKLFMDLVHDFVSEQMRLSARDPGSSADLAARWPLIWEKTRSAINRTEAYNMDRKQVILDLFANLRRPLAEIA